MPPQEILDEIMENLERLPEVPYTALQVNQLLEQPDTDAQDLAKVITQDPSLTSKVLKLCNSAQYGFSRKIATISEAVSILGYKELKRIIYTIISHSLLSRPIQGYALEKGALWENAITSATYARYIANKVEFKDSELAFISGLLRDIGKIAVEGYINGKGNLLEQTARDQKCAFDQAEQEVVGVSHTLVGSKIAMRWNLPESLVRVIAYHHHPSEMPSDSPSSEVQLVSIVHLADTFTMMTGKGIGIDGLMYPLDPKVFEILNIKQDNGTLETLYSELLDLQEEINTIASSMDAPGGK